MAARQLGISVRRFDGWEPGETHHLERDGAGDVTRIHVRREPEWDEESRAWLIALAELEAAECRRCGTDLNESTSPEHDANNPERVAQYEPNLPIVCHHCAALNRSAKKYRDHDDAAALIHTAGLRPRRARHRRR